MIKLENLDNQSVEEILDEAKNKIVYLSEEWTDFQEADPGITLVELFAWLNLAQHKYLNVLSNEVQYNFLKLLDINLRKNKGSETYIEVSEVPEDVNVPIRTPWKSGSMVFENINAQTVMNSKILSVSFKNPEIPSEEEYYKFDGTHPFYLFGKNIDRKREKGIERSFILNFDNPLPSNSIFNLYFSIYSGKNIKRNPIRSGDKFEPMAKIKWEYYGINNGVTGWHEAEVVRDNTFGFLFSGIIKLKCNGVTECLNEVYKLKATLTYDEYDYPPRADNIITNVLRACQNETFCDNVIITKEQIDTDRTVSLPHHLAIYGRSEVYVKKSGGWAKTDLVTFKSLIRKGVLIVELEKIWDSIKHLKSTDEAIMVVFYDKDKIKTPVLGSGSNMSHQKVKLDMHDLSDNDLEIMVSEKISGEEIYFKWKRVHDFSSSGKFDRHYLVDKENGVIFFGDHQHGMAPRLGKSNIRVCRLRQTKGKNSNLNSGLIHEVVTQNKALQKSFIRQILPAVGGEDSETMEHARARAAELFDNPERAITVSDYESIVRKTPGLTFTNVKALPNYMPGEDVSRQNCVTIAVRWNRKVGLTLPKSFEKNIMNQLNKYRLINTKIKVVSPSYIGLVIGGDIVVDSSYREADRLIENEVKNFIRDINKDLGQTLCFGDLFGMIDKLEYVSRLERLRIIPLGEDAKKTASEDIVISPNGVYYLEKIEFNYIRSSEIFSE